MPTPPPALVDAVTRLKTAFFVRAMSLPPRVQRAVAGKPLRVDGHELSLQAQLMLRLQKIAREPATETLPLEQGRAAMTRQARMAGGRQRIGEVHEHTVPGADGALPARLYVPEALVGSGPGPLALFFHGGGMVRGDLDSHDAVCRFLAEQAGVRVLAVGYRLAPEHPFPAAVDDAWAAYAWVSDRAHEYDARPSRLAVVGDSAGGHLAAATAIRAAQEGRDLAFQVLIYPMTELCSETPSRELFADGFYLTRAFIEQAEDYYLAGGDPRDPRGSVLHAEIPPGLAPAYLCTAGFDPLRDEGDAYAAALQAAGVVVEHERFTDHVHGFANLLAVEGPAKEHMHRVAAALREGLVRPGGGANR